MKFGLASCKRGQNYGGCFFLLVRSIGVVGKYSYIGKEFRAVRTSPGQEDSWKV